MGRNAVNRTRKLVAASLLALGCQASPVLAAHEGLWAGTLTLNGVSGVNRAVPDFAFDLSVVGVKVEDSLVARGASGWERTTSSPGAGWNAVTGAWVTAAAPLTSSGTAVYARREINVRRDPSAYASLKLRLWRQDGVVVYLNGAEVFRNNVGAGLVTYATYATSATSAADTLEVSLPASSLQQGLNVVAAEVHPSAAASPRTASFDLDLRGILSTPDETELVAPGSSWQVLDNGAQPSGWPTTSTGWSSASAAPFGYGTDVATVLTYSSGVRPAATYFKRAFGFPSGKAASDFTHLRFQLLADDGAAVYLDGREGVRTNLPDGTLTYATAPLRALGPSEGGRYEPHEIDLREASWAGVLALPNTLTVEVHQHPSERTDAGRDTAVSATPAELSLRLLLHQGSSAKLLKEVIRLYDVAQGADVLLANPSQLASYQSAATREGQVAGRRLSAVGYDFPGSALACTGSVGSTVTCSLTLAQDYPTNPFLHRYHPDHDNLDARYENAYEADDPQAEVFEIGRTITVSFSPRYPANPSLTERVAPPGWGYSELGGTYAETITGLHRDPITVEGWFTLTRVSTASTLVE